MRMALRRGAAVWLSSALLIVCTGGNALARPGTVRLTNGDIAQVEILALELGKQVTVKLSDGSQKILPWQWIVSVELAAAPPPPPVQPKAPPPFGHPAAAPAAAAPGVGLAVAGAPAAGATAQRILQLEAEYQALAATRPGIAGPIVLTAIGFGLGGFLTLVGVAVDDAADSVDEFGDPSSTDSPDTMPVYVLGGLGLAAGAGGLVWMLTRIGTRTEVSDRMKPMKEEIDRLRLNLQPIPGGGMATVGGAL